MDPTGFLHNKVDVKILILFILARIDTPLTKEDIYEIAYQDDSMNYFVFSDCLPELVETGHIQETPSGGYMITEKGRNQGSFVEDSLAVPIRYKVNEAIEIKLNALRHEDYLKADVTCDENGYWSSHLYYRNGSMPLMTLSMMAPNEAEATKLAESMKRQATNLYTTALNIISEE